MNDNIPDKLKQDYYTKQFIDLVANLSIEQRTMLKKLGIEITNEKYTHYNFSLLNAKLIKLRKSHNLLKEKGINLKEYIQLLHTFSIIEIKYNL